MLVGHGRLRGVLGESRPRAASAAGTDADAVGVPSSAPAGPDTAAADLDDGRADVTGPGKSVWRDPVTWAIAVTVCCAYFVISLLRLLRLAPASWDLGIYTEYVKQLSQLHAPVVDVRGPGFNLLGDHFQVAVAVLAPFFRVFPSPVTLLFFQAVATAVSVFPVAAAGRALTGRATGRLIGFAYGFSWGLQQMIDFDFHEIALAVPLLAFSLSALVRRKPVAVIGWAVPLVFVKEDQGFTVAAIGVLLGVSAAFPRAASGAWRARLPYFTASDGRYRDGTWGDGNVALWGGLFLMAWGLLWSVLAITVIIPHFNPVHDYYYWKDGGVVGGHQSFSVGGLIGQAASGWPTKLPTVVLLLLPTAFAALGSPVVLLALPSLALRFLSTNNAYWGTQWHYNATLMPILFIAAAEAIGRLRGGPALAGSPGAPPAGALTAGTPATGALTAGTPATGALTAGTQATGALAPGTPAPGPLAAGALVAGALAAGALDSARGLLRAAQRGIARHGGAMMAAVTVALAFQFPLSNLWQGSTYQLGAHVAAADAAMAVVPDGVTVQTTLDLLAPLAARTDTFWIGNPGNPVTEYVVFDGADSDYSPAISNVPAFIKQLYPGDGYVQVFGRDDVYVFRRG
jgi:uncharacterized membrane protein